jgi:acetolactate synthase-1/2/3 large subunit
MKILSGGDLVIDCLVRQGVKQVFSIVGGQMGTLYDAIGRTPGIDVFVPRNETVVPIMAAGYTASSGVPSVSMTTVGAGVVYEVAGLLKAWLDYLPVVSIAPQVQSYKMKPHQESLQACNQDELFAPITKWNAIVYHWQRIPQLVDRAFREALSGVPGPVHLDVPVDVLFKRRWLGEGAREALLPPVERTRYAGAIVGDGGQLHRASVALAKAERPVVILGQGVGRPGRHEEIRVPLGALGMPTLNTLCSGGPMGARDLHYAGNLALFAGTEAGREALGRADLLLVVGIDRYTRAWVDRVSAGESAPTIVQVESDPAALLPDSERVLPVYADPTAALTTFARAPTDAGRDLAAWREALEAAAVRGGAQLARELDVTGLEVPPGAVADDAIVVADGKQACALALTCLRAARYGQLFVMDERDMRGAGLPFAIGAALANPRRPVVLLCDRDALFTHVRELQPIAAMGLPLSIVCYDDASRGPHVVSLRPVLESLGCTTQVVEGAGAAAPLFRAGPRAGPRALLIPTGQRRREEPRLADAR